jgi:hypothetical protein
MGFNMKKIILTLLLSVFASHVNAGVSWNADASGVLKLQESITDNGGLMDL